jgi:von Willebrand factor type A C-terminal domain/von Willebrand factor type A domain
VSTTDAAGAAPFTAETFQNQYLAAGSDVVDAVVTVTAAGDPEAAGAATTAAGDRAEVVVVDCSGSMGSGRKMEAAKDAAQAAVDVLADGVQFAIVAGDHEAKLLWPVDGRSFAVADDDDRSSAREAIARLAPAGGTAIGTWLDLTRRLFAATDAEGRHAILLTDGRNEHQQPGELAAAVEACRGLFQCDCRGVGVDWEVEELRGIATALLGTVDIVADPSELAADFQAMIASSQSRALPHVSLRLWAPQGAVLESLRQVAPEVVDLSATGTAVPSAPLARDFLLGGWTPGESRDYHLRVKVKAGGVGDEMLAGRVSLVLADGTVATQALVKATWTDDTELSTRMDRHVAHYTGQVELADAIHAGLAAAKAGDDKTATVKLGRAVQLAAESGHEDTMRLLKGMVEVDDAESGTVRLKAGAEKAAEMTLDTRSTRTVRLGKAGEKSADETPAEEPPAGGGSGA